MTWDLPHPRLRARGTRSARPVRRQAVNSRRPSGPAYGRTQRATALYVERLIDGFVADAHGLASGKVEPQALGNLLRAPGRRPSPGLPRPVPAAFPGHGRAGHRRPARGDNDAGEPILHVAPQRRVGRQFRHLRTPGGPLGVPLRRGGPILQAATARGGVAPQLTRDRRSRPP